MTHLRLVIVARHFWPWVDDATLRLQSWLTEWNKLGIELQLLTPQWHMRWPLRCVAEEIQVHRIGPAPSSPRGMKAYLKNLIDWMILHRQKFDAILFDSGLAEANACCATRELADKAKLYWFEASGESGLVPAEMPREVLDALRRVDQVLVPGAAEERLLRAVGIKGDKIDRLGLSGGKVLARGPTDRQQAKQILSHACGDLFVPMDGRVVLVPSCMRHPNGIRMFLQAIDPILDQQPNLRVWFVGDGPQRGQIYERTRDMDGARQIAMPGNFDSPEELLQVADVCVLTTPGEGLGFYAPMAWTNRIPCLLPNTAQGRECTPASDQWGLYGQGDMMHLRELLLRALGERNPNSNEPNGVNRTRPVTIWSLPQWEKWLNMRDARQAISTAEQGGEDVQVGTALWKRWRQ